MKARSFFRDKSLDEDKLKVIEFFAGIGAYHQALKELEIPHEIVGISEIDNQAISAYQELHGQVNSLGDIREIKELPYADMWCYSFPCTDISMAGQMKGMRRNANTQSSLLWEIERLIESTKDKPKYLIMENVPTLVGKKFIGFFQIWLDYLDKLGYRNYWQCLNARNYGVAQNRDRVFMVSILGDESYIFPKHQRLTTKLKDYLEDEVEDKYFISEKLLKGFRTPPQSKNYCKLEQFRPLYENSIYAWTIATKGGSRISDNFIVMPEKTKKGNVEAREGDGVYIDQPHQKRGVVQKGMIQTLKTSGQDLGVVVKRKNHLNIRKLTPLESWRLMGWSDEDFEKVKNFSDTTLYRLAGNSVVVPVLKEIFRTLFIDKCEVDLDYYKQLKMF